MTSSPLILGGHSFIQQLGNDPQPSEATQLVIVAACLDQGITWFDTTYQPERLALGKALARLGRRAEVTIIAWNFFVDFDNNGEVGGPDYYQPHHIEQMLAQLQTNWIDCLVVHDLTDPDENQRQLALAQEWQAQGLVKRLGTWYPPENADQVLAGSPFSFMVHPNNITTSQAAPVFAACKRLGWENFACSPFVRGWELDKLAQRLTQTHGGETCTVRGQVADILLRYSLFQPDVDRLIVAIRNPEWVTRNIQSIAKGPVTAAELTWLGI